MIYELIGYTASVLVAISLMMSSILRLRIINLIGALIFTLYGILINAVPVAAVNLFIVGINVFHLIRIFRTHEYFRILEVGSESEYLHHFVELHHAEMALHSPDFRFPLRPSEHAVFILRDVVPAGLFIGELGDNGQMHVTLDYVLPGYRDFKIGRFLFDQRADWFTARGVTRLMTRAGTREHARYLRRIGFALTSGNGDTLYTREIPGEG